MSNIKHSKPFAIKKIFSVLTNTFSIRKLRSKFIITFFLLVLFPLTAIGLITYKTAEDVIQDNVSMLELKDLTKTSTDLDHYIEDIQNTTDVAFSNDALADYFTNLSTLPIVYDSYSNYQQLANANSGYRIISDIINLRGDKLTDIYFLDNVNVYFVHPLYSYRISPNNYLDEVWYKKFSHTQSSIFAHKWQAPNKNKNEYTFSFARVLRKNPSSGTNNSSKIGILRFDLDYQKIKNVIEAGISNSYKDSSLYILDQSNNIIYSKDDNDLGKSFDYLNNSNGQNPIQGVKTITIEGKKMYLAYYTSLYTSWRMVNVIPVDEVLQSLTTIKYIVIGLIIASLIIVLFLSSATSSVLLKPIKKLTSAMKEIEKGNFSTRVSLKNKDETKYLGDSFNNMAENIENLITKVYYAELKQREAELYSLQSQINPHFLYNTLESIRGVALSNNMQTIAQMTKSLSQIFRYSIEGNILVPFKSELSHLDNYMLIQNFRHDNKFSLIYNISDEILKYYIPKLTLQPIVENSIKHGLEMKMGKGEITITARKSEDRIIVEIHDTGKGISSEKLEELNNILLTDTHIMNEKESNGPGTGIGVRNVNIRLKLHFGNQYGMRFIKSESGTIAQLDFPAIEQEEKS